LEKGVAGYLATYEEILTPAVSRSELEAALAMPYTKFGYRVDLGDSVLDGFCGTGRHAFEAVRLGFDSWTCFDCSEVMLAKAAEKLELYRGCCTLVRQDARNLLFSDRMFRYYQVMGNSALGLFDDPCDDGLVLNSAARVLRPGGFLVFDLSDHEYVKRCLPTRVSLVCKNGELVIVERVSDTKDGIFRASHTEYRFKENPNLNPGDCARLRIERQDGSVEIFSGDQLLVTVAASMVDIQSVTRWVYTVEQVVHLLENAGFESRVDLKAYNYDDTSDRFGTMGVRHLFIGKLVSPVV
jgi:ubiquinone/menaquinone biosynthesis C-methylase UbiE